MKRMITIWACPSLAKSVREIKMAKMTARMMTMGARVQNFTGYCNAAAAKNRSRKNKWKTSVVGVVMRMLLSSMEARTSLSRSHTNLQTVTLAEQMTKKLRTTKLLNPEAIPLAVNKSVP